MTARPDTHLVDLHDGWSVWRWFWIRGAGFPARGVLALAAPAAAAAADRILELERQSRVVRTAALADLKRLYPNDAKRAAAKQAHDRLARRQRPRDTAELEAEVQSLRGVRALEETLAKEQEQFGVAYTAARAATAEAIRSVASDPRFREAMIWQNRPAVRLGVDWLLAHPGLDNSQTRSKQKLVASYLQRYCVKNDTIGFFGPMCWGTFDPASSTVDVQPGRELVRERRVYLEHWAIDAVARAISAEQDTRRFLAPRLVASAAIDGTTLRYGFDRSKDLPPAFARLLAACTGETPAYAIVRELVADASLDLAEDEVYAMLEDAVAHKLVVWTLEPSALIHPERELHRLLDRIDEPAIRQRSVALLERLEHGRDRIAAAVGDVVRLEPALEELDTVFREISGQEATRGAGQTYAARTPIYEDCIRDLAMTIGRPVLDRLGPVFCLVARSARWFTHEIATRFRAALHESYAAIAHASSGPIRYLRFWRAIQHLVPEGRVPGLITTEVEQELARRWAAVLELDLTQSCVNRTVAELEPRIARAFDAERPGWPTARHVSPDVLVAARSIDDIARGAFTLVLGEVHIGNSLMGRMLVDSGPHDDDDLVMWAYDRDIACERVMTTESRERVTRADDISWSHLDLDLEVGASKSWRSRDHVLRAADLVVEEANGSLVVRDLRSGRTFDVVAFLERYLAFNVNNHFKPAPQARHVPRIVIDGVVLAREQWRFAIEELTPVTAETRGADQFAAVRAWAAGFGIPRWVFAKVPEEMKPMFVDLASPLYVESFASLVRTASSLTLTEMLPTVEETWLPDAVGQTYTAELRIVAVDPAPWTAPECGA